MDIDTTTYPEDDSAHIGAILGSLVVVLTLILLLILVRVVWKRMQTQRKQENDESSIERKTLLKEAGEVQGTIKKEETDVKNEQKNRDYDAHIVGVKSKPKERKHFIKEVSFSSESKVTDTGVKEAGLQNEPEENELVFTETDANSELEGREYSVIETNVKSEPEESEHDVQDDSTMENLGDYDLWRTNISDHFSKLTEDEVFVLFCFLCSDSGPPDFTDTEWLDMLNEIRKDMYDNENPVTRDKAQQTLDRLKSRDYLWVNQDKITKDTEVETMYKIASLNSHIPFLYCSYNTVSVYLRSRGYNRKPGEKCIISDDSVLDAFLVRRLQMNLLTHVIMEDIDIYHWIYLILAVPENIVKDSKDKREKYLIDLRTEGEPLHVSGRSQNSADHVTWLWRYKYDAGPAIVRSCIGLHPHWDIYIIDNKAYRKP
ncbi:uncharacterized protein LOC134262764, partial [Saccostrea cucullata]|uniref:uncharacterized protein LOC134262764 n=1 Tax=Saccostrea cuccullata TaxID=36930 RepID=UPI002ED61069